MHVQRIDLVPQKSTGHGKKALIGYWPMNRLMSGPWPWQGSLVSCTSHLEEHRQNSVHLRIVRASLPWWHSLQIGSTSSVGVCVLVVVINLNLVRVLHGFGKTIEPLYNGHHPVNRVNWLLWRGGHSEQISNMGQKYIIMLLFNYIIIIIILL